MRLAFFLSDYPVTSETFVLDQIRGMVDRGHDVTILTGRLDKDVPDPLADRAALRTIRSGGRRRLVERALGLAAGGKVRRLRVALRAGRGRLPGPIVDILSTDHLGDYDAIVAHFGPAGVRAMYLREAGLVTGSIATIFHGIDLTETSLIARYLPHYRRLFASTECFLPISRLWQEKLLGWGAPPARTRLLRMGVDLDRLSLQSYDRELGAPLKILSVARFVEKKGLQYAIEAVAQSGEAELDLIGYGPLEPALREAARAARGRVRFLGKLPHSEVLERLARSDVFLLPSVTAANGDMEGVPVSLMEAMALGVAVLATRHSGVPELVTDGVHGILVPERDTAAIAAALLRLQTGDYDLPAMRRAARAKVESEFNNERLYDDLPAILDDLISG